MKYLIYSALALALFTASCKKGDSNQANINPEDPVALSQAVKVWHGARATGNPPVPNNNPNGPSLDMFSNNQSITAVSGGFAILKPQVTSGDVAGYYVQVKGATDYFKVDYSKPLGGKGIPTRNPQKVVMMGKVYDTDSLGNGNADSAIVIDIPSNIQPGQFCISYCAYDSLGNISNVIQSCVTVLSFGGDASVSYLSGKWKMTQSQDTGNGAWHDLLTIDTTLQGYYCYNNTLEYSCPTTSCSYSNYPNDIFGFTKADLIFSSNGGIKQDFDLVWKMLDISTSTCSSFTYNDLSQPITATGAWSYNSTTNILTLVFDFGANGVPDPYVSEFQLQKISNTHIVLYDPIQQSGTRLQK